jgi:hypothetical protein
MTRQRWTYSENFDRLGRPVQPKKGLPDWQHRLIQVCALVVIVVCLAIAVWGR